MPSPKQAYDPLSPPPSLGVKEEHVEYGFIGKLQGLKYAYRSDIRDRASLERNFREKFEALKRVHLSNGEFARLLDGIVTPDVFTAARTLRERNAFSRDDGIPLNYTLVDIKDWCKNSFEFVNQLRINTDIFERIATGSTIKTIGLPFFKELRIAIPALPEQQRVADCLTSLDDLITAAAQELDTFKTHKKGLMQQLFPSAAALEA